MKDNDFGFSLVSEKELKAQVDKLTVDTANKIKEVEKEVKDTKNYMTAASLGNVYKR